MADIVNLRSIRKRKDRAEKSAQAEANRLAFGRTKAEKSEDAARRKKSDRDLDQRKLETD